MTLNLDREILTALYMNPSDPISWTEIRDRIKMSLGTDVNIPSTTLHFHLKKLIEMGQVTRMSLGEELYYKIPDMTYNSGGEEGVHADAE